jgi:hypothetical protein
MLVCIKDTDTWKSRQVMVAESTFSLIMSREPTQMELDSLSSLATVADIRRDPQSRISYAQYYSAQDIDRSETGEGQDNTMQTIYLLIWTTATTTIVVSIKLGSMTGRIQ